MKTEIEKLEIQHIAPYLPFGLKAHDEEYGETFFVCSYRQDSDEWLIHDNIDGSVIEYSRDVLKPILRPLSDLHKDEFFDLYLDLCEELEVAQCKNMLAALENGQYYAIDIQKYQIMETFLSKHHFDWKYGLIEKGLAVDINTFESCKKL